VKNFLTTIISAAMLFSIGGSSFANIDDDNILHWTGCGISKKSYLTELAKEFEKDSGIRLEISGGGSTKGIQDVASGLADIGGSCRPPKDFDPKEMAVNTVPVGWDALSVVVHPSNPVNDISIENLRKVYMGEITNWKQLGGPDAKIGVFVREGKMSGVGYALRQFLFDDTNVEFPSKLTFPSTGPLEKILEIEPYAIGVTGISSAQHRKLKILSLEGVTPSYESIKRAEYFAYRPLYLIIPAKRNDPKIKKFARYVESSKAREILKKNQVVPYRAAINLIAKSAVYSIGE
jgi:phosphate transport system substrate-binding protein